MKNYLIKRNGDYNLFDDAFDSLFEPVYISNKAMKTDIKENEKEFTLEIELPGFNKNEIGVSYEKGYLDINAKKEFSEEDKKAKFLRRERSYSLQRSYYVGDIDEKAVKAKYENGVLSLSIPKEIEKKDTNHLIAIE